MPIPVLKLNSALIVTVQDASDSDLSQLKSDLADKVGRFRSHGVLIDVSAVDVMDSFATRTLEGIAHATRLRGAETVVVGIQPDVAFAMIQLGLSLDAITTALDLEEGMALLAARKVNGATGAFSDR
jgi:rsbT antagonist protein RsbS